MKTQIRHLIILWTLLLALGMGALNATAATVTVTFKANGGVGSDVVQTIESGVATPLTLLGRIGFYKNDADGVPFGFVEWRTNANGTGNSYADGQTVTITSNLTLYAVWRQVTVTFDPWDGNGTPYTQKMPYNYPTCLAPNTFTHDDVGGNQYYFLAWHTENAEMGGDYYGDQESVTLTNDLNLYVRWYHTGMSSVFHTWTIAPPANATYSSAYIRLDADITMSNGPVTLIGSKTNVAVIDLNGHTLTAKNGERLFHIQGTTGSAVNGIVVVITNTSANDSYLLGGTADKGGCIYMQDARLVLTDGVAIQNCRATGVPTYPVEPTGSIGDTDTGGGAVYVENSVFAMAGGVIGATPSAFSCTGTNNDDLVLNYSPGRNNSAYEGSAVFVANGLFHMHGGRIMGNQATSYTYSSNPDNAEVRKHENTGGTVYCCGRMVMDGGEIYENIQSSGTIHIESRATVAASLLMTGGSIHDNISFAYNDAGNYGNAGALFTKGADADMRATAFISQKADMSNNIAVRNGGACMFHAYSLVGVTGGTINNNKTLFYHAGAIILDDSYSTDDDVMPVFKNCRIEGNETGTNGGAIYVRYPAFIQEGTIIVNNTAKRGNGGGIYVAVGYNSGGLSVLGTGIRIQNNTSTNGAIKPQNVYLEKSRTIAVKGTFNPDYFGICADPTQDDPSLIPIFEGESTVLSPLYTKISNGSINTIFDDEQLHNFTYPGSTTIYFGNSSHWSALQQTVNALPSCVGEVYQIGSVKDLTAFLWYVNNIDTYADLGTGAQPGANGKLIADIDMEGHYWEPVANYSGTFDGDGHVISNLRMVTSNSTPDSYRGMFGRTSGGTITNLILKDCEVYDYDHGSSTTPSYLGAIVSEMHGGEVSNCFINGALYSSSQYCTIGGVAGLVDGNAKVHSCGSTPALTGISVAGMAGLITSGSSLKNSFSNPYITYLGSVSGSNINGLVVENRGLIDNCYTLLQGYTTNVTLGFKCLLGSNSGTASHVYIPSENTKLNRFINTNGGSIIKYAKFRDTSLPYLYKHRDTQGESVNDQISDMFPTGEDTDKQLMVALNKWVTVENTAGGNYSYWFRPTTKTINNDYPVLRLPKVNAIASNANDGFMEYGDINSLLAEYTSSDDAICFYGQKEGMNGNASSAAKLHIDQEGVLTQSGTGGAIKAYVGIVLENDVAQTPQWHMFSTSLQNAPLGVNYAGNNTEYPFSWGYYPGMPYFQFYPESEQDGYFPSHRYGEEYVENNTIMGGCNYYSEWDYYSYYEPDYHWINFKRNSNSHWHEDDEGGTKINYTNETTLPKGKGYFLAVKEDTYLQSYGTLNNGTMDGATSNIYKATVTNSIDFTKRQGFNLVGNPYQSYLDFKLFADANSNLWGGDATQAYYFVIKGNEYRKYAYDASANQYAAPRLLHPHQGFFIVAESADENGTALVFNDDMRRVRGNNVPFRGAEQPAYPLVNLIVSDDEGKRDIVTIELGRPDKGGAKVMRNMLVGKGLIYCRYNDEDYAIAFTQPGMNEASIRFETTEDCIYTLTWDAENGEFAYLHLIDNITGSDIDCLTTSEYRFTSKTTDYTSRFRLLFDYTGVEENGEDGLSTGSDTSAFAFQMGDKLVVNGEGTLQLIDMNGHMLNEWNALGTQSTVNLPHVAQGIYLLRLIGKDRTKIQKIVIR